MVAKREYASPTREQGKLETRERILEAVVRVILEQGIHAFSVQNVAERSGISHRTVYRHFGSREGLLEGLSESLQESLLAAGLSQPTDAGGWAAYVEPLFELFSRSAINRTRSVRPGPSSRKRWSCATPTLRPRLCAKQPRCSDC